MRCRYGQSPACCQRFRHKCLIYCRGETYWLHAKIPNRLGSATATATTAAATAATAASAVDFLGGVASAVLRLAHGAVRILRPVPLPCRKIGRHRECSLTLARHATTTATSNVGKSRADDACEQGGLSEHAGRQENSRPTSLFPSLTLLLVVVQKHILHLFLYKVRAILSVLSTSFFTFCWV